MVLCSGLTTTPQVFIEDLPFFSDTLQEGWGAYLGNRFASTCKRQDCPSTCKSREPSGWGWRVSQTRFVIEFWVSFATMPLQWFTSRIGETMSSLLNHEFQFILRWEEKNSVTLVHQFVMGKRNVIVDSLSFNQVTGSEWFLHDQVFWDLQKR